ncbi:MAG: hypothetical protein ACTSW3_04530 [Promethearchaeota archaeon]
MDESEKIYQLSAKMATLIYKLGLSGWQDELTLSDSKTGREADIRIKVEVRNKSKIKNQEIN